MESETQHTLEITRTFNAPTELVWRAWTEPEHLLRWLCPKDFTVLFADVNLREGGAWRSGMCAPDGSEYVAHGTYRTIQPHSLLAFTHAWEKNQYEPSGLETLVTVTLADKGEQTTMTFQQTGLATQESRDGHHGGWSEAFDNLGQHLLPASNND